MACSPVDNSISNSNCVVAFIGVGTGTVAGDMVFRPFSVNAADGSVTPGGVNQTEVLVRADASCPTITANNANADPQFLIGYNRARNASPRTVWIYERDRNSVSYYSFGSVAAAGFPWLPPAAMGVHMYSGTTYKRMFHAE